MIETSEPSLKESATVAYCYLNAFLGEKNLQWTPSMPHRHASWASIWEEHAGIAGIYIACVSLEHTYHADLF